MRPRTQISLLKWASLLAHCQVTSIIDIQNSQILVTILNKLQPAAFEQLYQIDQRASNSLNNVIKCINSYYKKELRCNISSLVQNLNIFKNPLQLWQLLIGVAIKGRNRDSNINVILQMQQEQQSQLMLLVEEVIDKLSQFDIPNSQIRESVSSSSSQQTRNRNQSTYSKMNSKKDQMLNEILEENEAVKQKNIELHQEVSQLKSKQENIKKSYEERLNFFKNQRYAFIDVLTGNCSGIQGSNRNRKQSNFKFRESVNSNQSSRINDDPLHGLNVTISGSLPQIAADLLNSLKKFKKQSLLQSEKASILEDHNKDLKLSLNRLSQQKRHLKEQLSKQIQIQKQLETLKAQNSDFLRNQTELLKMLSDLQEQKQFLREMVDKLKQQKNHYLSGFSKQNNSIVQPGDKSDKNTSKIIDISSSNNLLGTNSNGFNQKFNIMKAPSMLLRQMSSQIEPQSTNLNEQIDQVKNPLLRNKFQKQINELKQKNSLLRQQNNELKHVNKMLQKTIHNSMQKSQQIQKNIEQGYLLLFGDRGSSVIMGSSIGLNGEQKQSDSRVNIKLPFDDSNVWNSNKNAGLQQVQPIKQSKSQQQNSQIKQKTTQQSQKDNKMIEFYSQMKQLVESYEQKQMLLIIEIESLKTQLSDLMHHKTQTPGTQQISELKQKHPQTKKTKRQLTIRKDVVNHKTQSQQYIQSPIQNVNNQLVQDKGQFVQGNEQLEVQAQPENKEESVLMFQINVSKPGEKKQSHFKPQDQNHQQYQVRRSKLNAAPSTQMKTKILEKQRNKHLYPSEQFIQIQQGEELPQIQIPKLPCVRINHQSDEKSLKQSTESIKIDMKQPEKEYLPIQIPIQHKFVGSNQLNLIDVTNKNKRFNMVSGIQLIASQEQRKSFFGKSGFYNQSFIEISNRLQSQIQADINEISEGLNQKFYNNYMTGHQQSRYKNENTHIKSLPDDNFPKQNLPQSAELIAKLQKIKKSYLKIKHFHVTTSQQLQSQLKQQLDMQKSQLLKLKIINQSLKQSLTKMIAQKEHSFKKLRQIKVLIGNLKENNRVEALSQKFLEMFDDISQLELMMPELQECINKSKLKQLQMMHQTQKYKRQKLEEQIQLLMETLVWLRNKAISEESDSQV